VNEGRASLQRAYGNEKKGKTQFLQEGIEIIGARTSREKEEITTVPGRTNLYRGQKRGGLGRENLITGKKREDNVAKRIYGEGQKEQVGCNAPAQNAKRVLGGEGSPLPEEKSRAIMTRGRGVFEGVDHRIWGGKIVSQVPINLVESRIRLKNTHEEENSRGHEAAAG